MIKNWQRLKKNILKAFNNFFDWNQLFIFVSFKQTDSFQHTGAYTVFVPIYFFNEQKQQKGRTIREKALLIHLEKRNFSKMSDEHKKKTKHLFIYYFFI